MKRWLIISIPPIGLFVYYLLFVAGLNPPASQARTTEVVRGPLAVWSAYEGRLEARKVVMIMSRFRGNATVIELAPEASKVSKGDVLVRFDSSGLEREVLKLKRDYALAKSELKSLKQAKLPLEIRDLEMELMKTRSALSAEQQYLDACIELAKKNLVSEQETEKQRSKVTEIKTQLETLELRMRLTKKYLHPSELRRAKAKLNSVKQELKIAREQLKNSVVLAPSDGVVVYKQIYVGTEFRVVRIGDSIFPNQPFIMLPDMSNLEVYLDVPEVELAMIQKGKDVFIRPLAYPEVRLPGLVETIGSMAQNLPDKPGWQKFFHVVIGLKDFDSRLKPGMSVTAHILSYYSPHTILIPRTTVWWEVEKPFAKVLTDSYQETRELKLGMANEEYYEVLEGLKPGDEVIIE